MNVRHFNSMLSSSLQSYGVQVRHGIIKSYLLYLILAFLVKLVKQFWLHSFHLQAFHHYCSNNFVSCFAFL